jgi:hypothetical protein
LVPVGAWILLPSGQASYGLIQQRLHAKVALEGENKAAQLSPESGFAAYFSQGNRMNSLDDNFAAFAAPCGVERLFLGCFRTLKRGASDRSASGAIEAGASLVKKNRFMRLPWRFSAFGLSCPR